jgi:hypothetical protein
MTQQHFIFHDLLTIICQYLTIADMQNVILVNTEWNKLSSPTHIHWKYMLRYQLWLESKSPISSFNVYVQRNELVRHTWRLHTREPTYAYNRLQRMELEHYSNYFKKQILKLNHKYEAYKFDIVKIAGNIVFMMKILSSDKYSNRKVVKSAASSGACAIARVACCYQIKQLTDDEAELIIEYLKVLILQYNASLERFCDNVHKHGLNSTRFYQQYLFPKLLKLDTPQPQSIAGSYVALAVLASDDQSDLEKHIASVKTHRTPPNFFQYGNKDWAIPCLPWDYQNISTLISTLNCLESKKEYSILQRMEHIAGRLLFSRNIELKWISPCFTVTRQDALYLYCSSLAVQSAVQFPDTVKSIIHWLLKWKSANDQLKYSVASRTALSKLVYANEITLTPYIKLLLQYGAVPTIEEKTMINRLIQRATP